MSTYFDLRLNILWIHNTRKVTRNNYYTTETREGGMTQQEHSKRCFYNYSLHFQSVLVYIESTRLTLMICFRPTGLLDSAVDKLNSPVKLKAELSLKIFHIFQYGKTCSITWGWYQPCLDVPPHILVAHSTRDLKRWKQGAGKFCSNQPPKAYLTTLGKQFPRGDLFFQWQACIQSH